MVRVKVPLEQVFPQYIFCIFHILFLALFQYFVLSVLFLPRYYVRIP